MESIKQSATDCPALRGPARPRRKVLSPRQERPEKKPMPAPNECIRPALADARLPPCALTCQVRTTALPSTRVLPSCCASSLDFRMPACLSTYPSLSNASSLSKNACSTVCSVLACSQVPARVNRSFCAAQSVCKSRPFSPSPAVRPKHKKILPHLCWRFCCPTIGLVPASPPLRHRPLLGPFQAFARAALSAMCRLTPSLLLAAHPPLQHCASVPALH